VCGTEVYEELSLTSALNSVLFMPENIHTTGRDQQPVCAHLKSEADLLFLISDFGRVVNVVCFFLLGNSPASAYKIQTPGNYPEEKNIKQTFCSFLESNSFSQTSRHPINDSALTALPTFENYRELQMSGIK
jgi:hypothetical protein